MPRFYFDVRLDDQPWSEDEVGNRFDGSERAKREAIAFLAEAAKDYLHQHDRIEVRVRDSQPEPVLILALSLTTNDRA